MLYSRSHLELFHELLKRQYPFTLTPGLRIARGFADAGYEEYSALAGYSAVSLHTGKTVSLEADYQNYYFPVYSVDEMGKILYERECDIEEIQYQDQRTWILFISDSEGEVYKFEGALIEEAFLKALLWVLER